MASNKGDQTGAAGASLAAPTVPAISTGGAPMIRLHALLQKAKGAEAYYADYQRRYRGLALSWRLLIGILSAVATILLGITVPKSVAPLLKNLALAATALVAFFAMIEAYRDDRSNYVRMATAFNRERSLDGLEKMTRELSKLSRILLTEAALARASRTLGAPVGA